MVPQDKLTPGARVKNIEPPDPHKKEIKVKKAQNAALRRPRAGIPWGPQKQPDGASRMVETSLTVTGMYHVELLTSKTRIAPMKALTIPRLEMMSGRILARLMVRIETALEAEVETTEIHYWLDSKTAFCWIKNRGKWKRFVRHRPNEIMNLTKTESLGLLSARRKSC